MSEQCLEELLSNFVQNKNWQKVLSLSDQFPLSELSRFLWVWPNEECLEHIKRTLQKNHISNILSIGCGSGLLEWIIREATGTTVSGLELDNSWWTSTYSPKSFINLNFVKDISPEYLQKCATNDTNEEDFALLFCYFNNKCAFDEYVRAYDGQFIIIIGPEEGSDIVTDPMPLRPQFEYCSDYTWKIDTVINITNSKNVIVFYKKIDFK